MLQPVGGIRFQTYCPQGRRTSETAYVDAFLRQIAAARGPCEGFGSGSKSPEQAFLAAGAGQLFGLLRSTLALCLAVVLSFLCMRGQVLDELTSRC